MSNVSTENTKTNSSGERVYDFLIWTPEMKESLPLWDNHFGKEAEYFNKTHVDYYTTALIETINETRRFRQRPTIFEPTMRSFMMTEL